ncbi:MULTISPECIES: hypothetical protein [unclassified Streptomyces]|uniref:hypothetical protein n=1 Tax=unclassified Streptomyces TaxID=2593676 RepID=UPI002E196645|nr:MULTISPECIES: hypothetical protein [unclassified Streptomyces]
MNGGSNVDASAVLFAGRAFAEVGSIYCRLVDEVIGQVFARCALTGGGSRTVRIMAAVQCADGGWKLTAIGEPTAGRAFQDLMPAIGRHL